MVLGAFHLLPEPGRWLDRLLARVPEPGELRTQGLLLAATVHRMGGALDTARACLREARASLVQAGDRLGLALVDERRASSPSPTATGRGRARSSGPAWPSRASSTPPGSRTSCATWASPRSRRATWPPRARRSRRARRWSGRAGGRPRLGAERLGVVARLEGDLARARTIFEARLAHAPDAWNVAMVALGGLGDIAREEGDFAGARAFYDRLRAVVERGPRPSAGCT